jgi:flavodoxin
MKISIVYFSLSSRTKTLSELIAEYFESREYNVEVFRLETSETGSFFKNCSYALRKKYVTLKGIPQIADSEIVFLGSPVWAFDITPAVRTYLDSVDLQGKKVFIFTTYGSGSGKGRAMQNFIELVERKGGVIIGTGEVKGRRVKDEFPEFKDALEKKLKEFHLL